MKAPRVIESLDSIRFKVAVRGRPRHSLSAGDRCARLPILRKQFDQAADEMIGYANEKVAASFPRVDIAASM